MKKEVVEITFMCLMFWFVGAINTYTFFNPGEVERRMSSGIAKAFNDESWQYHGFTCGSVQQTDLDGTHLFISAKKFKKLQDKINEILK